MGNIDDLTATRPGTFHCFHGTSSDFDIADFHEPAYFSSSPSTAAFFCRNQAGAHVIDAVLVSSNWYEMDFHGDSWGGSSMWWDGDLFDAVVEYGSDGDEEEREYWQEEGVTTDLVADYLNNAYGYDLVIFHNVIEEDGSYSSIYVAFRGCRAYAADEYEREFL